MDVLVYIKAEEAAASKEVDDQDGVGDAGDVKDHAWIYSHFMDCNPSFCICLYIYTINTRSYFYTYIHFPWLFTCVSNV